MTEQPEPAVVEQPAWEPGAPSARAMAPSVVGGALVPLAVYCVVRSHVHGDATALMIAGAPAAGWVLIEWRLVTVHDGGGATIDGLTIGS